MEHHEILSGLVRLHILHHAVEQEIYGLWMIEELGRHGYRIGPGTLYPMLHSLEKNGYLTSRTERTGNTSRKLYKATEFGREGLTVAKARLKELLREALPEETKPPRKKTASRRK